MTQDVIKIRVNPKLILPEYLVYFLNSAKGQKLLHPIIVEGTRSRFGLTPFKEVEILVPPIAEQKRIATIAQKADRLRRTRRYTLELSDSYLRSVFLEMFGDLEKNSKAFPLFPFDDVCAIDAEMVDPKLKQYQNHLHIGGANIESITGNLLDLKTAEEEGLISGKFLINPEHILFSKIRPKLRKVAYPRIMDYAVQIYIQ